MDLLISASELKQILSQVVLVDVREPEEYAESRIEGCKLIPLGELMNRAPRELNPNAETVVYCAHGVRSMHAVLGLKKLGFENVRSLQGGIVTWFEPSESGK